MLSLLHRLGLMLRLLPGRRLAGRSLSGSAVNPFLWPASELGHKIREGKLLEV